MHLGIGKNISAEGNRIIRITHLSLIMYKDAFIAYRICTGDLAMPTQIHLILLVKYGMYLYYNLIYYNSYCQKLEIMARVETIPYRVKVGRKNTDPNEMSKSLYNGKGSLREELI
jgi:hypothetical protein